MENVEYFEQMAGKALAIAYKAFPLPKEIPASDLARSVEADRISEHDRQQIAGHTLKGLECLRALPRVLTASGKETQTKESIGDQLVEAAGEGAKAAVKENVKDLVAQALAFGVRLLIS